MEYICKIKSPLGTLTISSDSYNICGLWLDKQKYFCKTLEQNAQEQDLPIFNDVRRWLDIYFSGKNPNFTLPLMPKGSVFQKSIWNNLCKIPYGHTITYGELAKNFEMTNNNQRTSARAVGNAVGHNPISILIPCHRVIAKSGNLTGYAGGLEAKLKLLELENAL
jgi:methylated-DNA-[protein]-cysteine S-methyltransferase